MFGKTVKCFQYFIESYYNTIQPEEKKKINVWMCSICEVEGHSNCLGVWKYMWPLTHLNFSEIVKQSHILL